MRAALLAVVVLGFGCGALTRAPDGGSGGGTAGGGSGGGAAGGTGGGSTGGSGGGAAGSAGGSGGGSSLPSFTLTTLDAGVWTRTNLTPSGATAQAFTMVRGLGADRLWVTTDNGKVQTWSSGGGWVDIFTATNSTVVFNDLLINSSGAMAAAGDTELLACASGCEQSTSWVEDQHLTATFYGLCERAGVFYAVGVTDSQAGILLKLTGTSWAQQPTAPTPQVLYACSVQPDGTLLLGGKDGVFHRANDGAGTLTAETVAPACASASANRFVELSSRLLLLGDAFCILERGPGGDWSAVTEGSGSGGFTDSFVFPGDAALLSGWGPRPQSWFSGTTVGVYPDPLQFDGASVWAVDVNTHYLAGRDTAGLTSYAGRVYKLTR